MKETPTRSPATANIDKIKERIQAKERELATAARSPVTSHGGLDRFKFTLKVERKRDVL